MHFCIIATAVDPSFAHTGLTETVLRWLRKKKHQTSRIEDVRGVGWIPGAEATVLVLCNRACLTVTSAVNALLAENRRVIVAMGAGMTREGLGVPDHERLIVFSWSDVNDVLAELGRLPVDDGFPMPAYHTNH